MWELKGRAHQHCQHSAGGMPHASPVGAGHANAQPAQQLAVLPARPKVKMALAEAREVSHAVLDVDDGLGVARREGGATPRVAEHCRRHDLCTSSTASDTGTESNASFAVSLPCQQRARCSLVPLAAASSELSARSSLLLAMVRRLTTRTRPDRSSLPLLQRELSDRRALPFALAEEACDARSQAPHQGLRAVRLAAAG